MNFSELYKNNRSAVERALMAMWCGESANDSQRAYIRQLRDIVGELFAPKNAVPVVCIAIFTKVMQSAVLTQVK